MILRSSFLSLGKDGEQRWWWVRAAWRGDYVQNTLHKILNELMQGYFKGKYMFQEIMTKE